VAKVRRARSAGTKRAPKPIALEVLIADMRRDLDALEAAAEVLRRRTK
jgi:hypothetical protein